MKQSHTLSLFAALVASAALSTVAQAGPVPVALPLHAAGAITAALPAATALPTPDLVSQAMGLGGTLPDVEDIDVQSAHVYDYTFTKAPTDWWVQSGIWEMTNRWACSPGWSWFGGRSNEVAAIWNKRKFSGDLSVQFYFGFKMENSGTYNDMTGEYKWWEYPADAAITIGGDGHNLSSGYTFLIGANDNWHTQLRRGDAVVADTQNPDALLTGYYDLVPSDMDRLIHRRWWYGRIDKVGSKVNCYLDNKLIFSYNDPKPLDAGQIALWTYNNGIMLSRVQVYYDREVKPAYAKITKNAVKLAAKPALKAAEQPHFAQALR